MEGVAKPPILLAHDSNKIKGAGSAGQRPLLKAKDHDMSAFKTVSSQGNRTLGVVHTENTMGIASYNDTDCHLIELTEGQERVLSGVFEHFSHIDEATKKRLIKACFVVEIF